MNNEQNPTQEKSQQDGLITNAQLVILSTRLASNRYTLFAGCSRWTNPNRSMARHIMYGGECLCLRKYRGTLFQETLTLDNYKEVTCKICIRKMNDVAG